MEKHCASTISLSEDCYVVIFLCCAVVILLHMLVYLKIQLRNIVNLQGHTGTGIKYRKKGILDFFIRINSEFGRSP
jgi:hypothetical protein